MFSLMILQNHSYFFIAVSMLLFLMYSLYVRSALPRFRLINKVSSMDTVSSGERNTKLIFL